MNILEGLQNISLALSAVMAAYFPSTGNLLPTPASSPEVKQVQQDMITRTGSYTYSGLTLKYIINIPKNGGEVTGKFSGACNGPISGKYSAGLGQEVLGKASASCPILLNKTYKVTYVAHLRLDEGKAFIDWTGDLPYTNGSGSFTFDFEPVK